MAVLQSLKRAFSHFTTKPSPNLPETPSLPPTPVGASPPSPPNNLRDTLMSLSSPLQETLNLPSRHAALYSTSIPGDGSRLPNLDPIFPAATILQLWNLRETWLNPDGAANHAEELKTCLEPVVEEEEDSETQSSSGDAFARFLRARDPAARVLRVSTRDDFASAEQSEAAKATKQGEKHKEPEQTSKSEEEEEEEEEEGEDAATQAERALLRLVASLVYSLVDLVPDDPSKAIAKAGQRYLSAERFRELQKGSIFAGLEILRALPKLALGRVPKQKTGPTSKQPMVPGSKAKRTRLSKASLYPRTQKRRLLILVDGMKEAFHGMSTGERCFELIDTLEEIAERNDAVLFFTHENYCGNWE